MSTAIIGGGVGGLTTALLLSASGEEVTIYERGNRLGGRLAYESNGTYRIDQGPTIVLLPEMLLEILEEAGISRDRIPLIPCDPMYRIHYADGTSFDKYSDPKKQQDEIESKFPGESGAFLRYMETMKELFIHGKEAFLERAFLKKSHFFTFKNVRLLHKMRVHKSVRALAAEFYKDSRLVDAFSLQTLYIGGAPFQSPALYSLIPYAEHAYGIWYVKGGYASLVDLLEEELVRRGVHIRLQSEITSIKVEHQRCEGVVLSDGSEHAHFQVVYNGDFPHLMSLLPNVTKRMKPKPRYIPSSGCVLVYLGLDKRWEEAPAHQFVLPPSLTDSLRAVFEEGRIPNEPSFYMFNPTALDDGAAPEGESVMYMLIPVPPAVSGVHWDEEVPALVDRVLQLAEERLFPGLREAIVWQQVRTPIDAVREGLYGGGSFGLAPLLSQSGVFRPQFAPLPIQGLYTVGASVHPGGGIPIVMQGAKLLTSHLEKERKAWNA
ncbi:capsular biosynthesis protein CpsH [Paenibacillus swuensis]|uniref:Capsular biosynthesis protein CpsH n=1 Tax=Paenibacillus swuensis TaxID=1178515 RepID=A0A172TJP9_9BACL|nr:phytoene desaturase family protein [Paenibacillus swuensis]ANE47250.1 capsular biosynthesis protein CpsH [Paenibacillus swuensis]